MALPLTRNTTYGPESPVRSADLNALQDIAVDLWIARVASQSMDMSLLVGGRGSPAADFAADDAVTYNGGDSLSAHWTWPLTAPAGIRVVGVSVWGVAGTYSTTGDGVSVLSKSLATGALTQLASVSRRSGASPWTFAVDHVVTASEALILRWYPGTSTAVIYACRVAVDWGG